jgi:hypothetical protein
MQSGSLSVLAAEKIAWRIARNITRENLNHEQTHPLYDRARHAQS